MTTFPCKVGMCITSWEISQISTCPLHVGFEFEAAAEKRLIVLDCYTMLQLCCSEKWSFKRLMKALIWSAVGKRNQKTSEWNAECAFHCVADKISWTGSHCLLFVFLIFFFFKPLGESKLRVWCNFVIWLWHCADLSSALESKPNTNVPILNQVKVKIRWEQN